MAANTAEFRIIVNADGLVTGIKQTRAFTEETKKAAKGAREAGDAHSNLNYRMNQGVVGASSAARSFSKLNQTIGQGNSGLVGAYATLAANAFAVSASFEALRSGAQATQILEGLELQGARTGRVLTLTAKSIEDLTMGALSSVDAMRAAALGSSAGLSGKDLRDLTEVATNASLVLGRNIPDSMDRIIKGVTKLEPELLDELGLMTKLTEASENYARANGKSAASLTNIEKRLAFVEAIKAEGQLKYDGVAEELGTNRLDQLGAAFRNLTNDITGTIATSAALGGIIDVLTKSSFGLQGALLLLGAYVARQYTASLRASSVETLNASKALDQKARALKEHTKLQMGDTKAALERAKADAKSAAELNITQRGKALATQEASLGGDRAAQEAWIKSRENSNKRYERELEKIKNLQDDASKSRKAKLQTNIEANNLEIASTKEAMKAEQAYSAARTRTANNDIRMRAAQQGSLAQGRAALAMEAAAALKLGQSYRNIIDSSRSYAKQLELTSQVNAAAARNATANGRATSILSAAMLAVAPAANRARVAIYSLVLGIKSVGIAFATALPWIGVITIAFSMAQAAYESFFKTQETKDKEKALEGLNTALETLSKSVKEFEKIQNSFSGSIGSRALKALTIQTGAMVELTDAYLQFADASTKAEKSLAKTMDTMEFLSTASASDYLSALRPVNLVDEGIGLYNRAILAAAPSASGDPALLGRELGLRTQTAAKAAKEMVDGFDMVTDLFFGNAVTDTEESLLKTIDTIAVYDKQLAESIKVTGDATETQNNIAVALTKSKPVWERASLAVNNFAEAVKTAETAQSDFMRSITPNTKFDNAVSAFTSLNNSITELQVAMGDSRFDQNQFSEILTNLGPSTTRVLDVADQLNLEAVKSQYSEIGNLEREILELQKQGLGNSSESIDKENKILELKNRITAALKNSEPSIIKATQEYQKQLVDAQIMAITMQGTLAIAQANLSVIQRRGVVVAEDASKEMKAQNAIISLQQSQLEAEKAFLELDLARQRVKLTEIENTLKLLKTIKDLDTVEQDRFITQQMQANATAAAMARVIGDERTANILESKNLRLAQARSDSGAALLKAQQEYDAELDNNRRLLAGIEVLEKNIVALGMNKFTAAEMTAAELRKQLEIDTQRASLIREQQNNSSSIRIINMEMLNIMRLGTKEIETQNFAIDERLKQSRKALEDENTAKKKALEIERDLAIIQFGEKSKRALYYVDQLDLLNRNFITSQYLLEVEALRDKVQLAAIKTTQEKLDLEKQVLSITEKTLEQSRELSNVNLERFNTILDLEAKRSGVTDTQSLQDLKALKAAEDQYKLAQQEYDLKVSLIKLEFALLEAQRVQLADNLAARLSILEERRSDLKAGLSETAIPGEILVQRSKEKDDVDKNIDIISSVIAQLNSAGDYKAAMNDALKAAEVLRDNARLNLKLQQEQGPRVTEGIAADFANQRARGTLEAERMSLAAKDAALEQGIAIANAERQVRGQVALTTEEIKKQKQELINLGMSTRDTTSERSIAFRFMTDELSIHVSKIAAQMAELGPEGQVASAAVQGIANITNSTLDFIEVMRTSEDSTSRWIAGLAVASSAISTISNILKSSADARIASIDREIEAEQRRDGKSAASVEKIKSLEKKKEEAARKSFETQKKLQMASVVVNTAAAAIGIAASLSSLGPAAIALIPVAVGMITALGAAQLALIASTSYQGASSSVDAAQLPSTLSIGRRGDTVDLARGPSANAGGEVGYLRGSQGMGTNANNFRTIGSAYGGDLMRGYGNRGFVVGEKGPEVLSPETPINVTPANDIIQTAPVNATINIQALDASGVQDVLVAQKGNIIKMLREAANASGQGFLEDVNVNVYTRPSVNKL